MFISTHTFEYNCLMAITMRWLGNAGFEFQIDSTYFLFDPFLTRPKARQVYVGRVAADKASVKTHIPKADHIFITHTHFDHSMDAPEIARLCGAVVYGSANTCGIMRAAGLPQRQIRQVSTGEAIPINHMQVSVLPAAHPWIPGYTSGKLPEYLSFPLRLWDYRMDDCYSFLLNTGESRILIWSSTDNKNAPQADILTCRAVSSQRWYDELLSQVNPRLVIPQHWNDFFQPLESPVQPYWGTPQMKFPPLGRINLKDFETRIKQAQSGVQVLLPEIFQPYNLENYLPAG